jgi:hydrocephalus-inducing protein
MEGGDQEVLLLNFMPHEYVKYKEEISFQINGLDVVNVYVHGEGTPLVVELVDPTQKLLTFGPIHMGKVAVIHVSFLIILLQFIFNWAKTMVW